MAWVGADAVVCVLCLNGLGGMGVAIFRVGKPVLRAGLPLILIAIYPVMFFGA